MSLERDALPPEMMRIRDVVRAFRSHESERAETERAWARQVASAREELPFVQIEHGGDTIRLGGLSPGCAACKSGRWDCLFVTLRCNVECPFCISAKGHGDGRMQSALCQDEDGLCERYRRAGVAGVGFTGGEPFLEPGLVLAWVARLRRELPGVYLWAYTNGLLLTIELLDRLAEAGLDEMRFNLAATRFEHEGVLRMMSEAVRRLPAVAVEVPALSDQGDRILRGVRDWACGGVKYLNLHEMIYEDGSASGQMAGNRVRRRMPDGHVCGVDAGSWPVAKAVLSHVEERRIPLAVNYCSLKNKVRQMRGRRRLVAPWVLAPGEELLEDGSAESVCHLEGSTVRFIRPSLWRSGAFGSAGERAALVRRLLPMSCEGEGQWVQFEPLPAGEAR